MKRFISLITLVLPLVFAPVLMGAATTNTPEDDVLWHIYTLADRGRLEDRDQFDAEIAPIRAKLTHNNCALLKKKVDPSKYKLAETLNHGVYTITTSARALPCTITAGTKNTLSFANLLLIRACQNRRITNIIIELLNDDTIKGLFRNAPQTTEFRAAQLQINRALTPDALERALAPVIQDSVADANGTLPYEHMLFMAELQSYCTTCLPGRSVRINQKVLAKKAALLNFLNEVGCSARAELIDELSVGQIKTDVEAIRRKDGCCARIKLAGQLRPLELTGAAAVIVKPSWLMGYVVMPIYNHLPESERFEKYFNRARLVDDVLFSSSVGDKVKSWVRQSTCCGLRRRPALRRPAADYEHEE